MITIEVIWDEPGEDLIARQLRNEFEERMGDYPHDVYISHIDDM